MDQERFYFDDKTVVVIRYTNHRGEVADRHIVPTRLWYGETRWHKGEQWLLEAFDVEKQAYRDFALKDITSWRPA